MSPSMEDQIVPEASTVELTQLIDWVVTKVLTEPSSSLQHCWPILAAVALAYYVYRTWMSKP